MFFYAHFTSHCKQNYKSFHQIIKTKQSTLLNKKILILTILNAVYYVFAIYNLINRQFSFKFDYYYVKKIRAFHNAIILVIIPNKYNPDG